MLGFLMLWQVAGSVTANQAEPLSVPNLGLSLSGAFAAALQRITPCVNDADCSGIADGLVCTVRRGPQFALGLPLSSSFCRAHGRTCLIMLEVKQLRCLSFPLRWTNVLLDCCSRHPRLLLTWNCAGQV